MRQTSGQFSKTEHVQVPKSKMWPPNPDKMNGRRAHWALQAVLKFSEETGQDKSESDLEEIIGDLLVDLGHLADRNSISLSHLIGLAMSMYAEETGGVGKQFERVSIHNCRVEGDCLDQFAL